ncbi:MAG: hypothetical protein P9L92_17795 [Candidatus Electryonea clarkiae]|nr:hypothetical protein [Candidatus Electryonea clarkiae]
MFNKFGNIMFWILISIISVLSIPGAVLSQEVINTHTKSAQSEEPINNNDKLQYVVAPILGYSTDEGFIIGGLSGITRPDGLILYPYSYYGTTGRIIVKIEGEVPLRSGFISGSTAFRRIARDLYSPVGDGQVIAKATVDRVKTNISFLKSVSQNVQIGPSLKFDMSQASDIESAEGNPLVIAPDRFIKGSVILLGPQFRYRTTDTMRPYDGTIISTSILAGRSNSDLFINPRFDLSADFSAALAKPVSNLLRFYIRGMTKFQLETPASVRNHMGGESTVRGHLEHRDYGRRLVAGRAQLNLKTITNWLLPSQIMNKLWDRLPIQPISYETVAFYDAGAVGDPDFGWRKTRNGFGCGLRVIVPPRIVGHFDIGYSADSGYRIYVGAGETL